MYDNRNRGVIDSVGPASTGGSTICGSSATLGIVIAVALASALNADELVMQPTAGEPLPGLTESQLAMYEAGRAAYQRVFTAEEGLGPVFNLPSCAACHSSPLGGGGTTTVNLFGFLHPTTGAFDPMHDLGGPVRQANAIDPACIEEVPLGANIDTRRLTLGAMGYGLIEAIGTDDILAFEDPEDADGDGVRGFANWVEALESPGEPMVGRFGWKAQLPSILSFSADAAHNELGLTSLLIPHDNAANAPAGSGSCDTVADPEIPDVAAGFLEEVTAFQRFMSPPPQSPRGGMLGEMIFEQIGCASCHRPSFVTTDVGVEEALQGVSIRPYSDFLLHEMPTIADGIPAGNAGGQDFRTPPLWGLRYRRKLMHDGSVPALDFEDGVRLAIERHGPTGEGAAAAAAFEDLDATSQDALVRFLRSLGRQDFDFDDDGDVDVLDYQGLAVCVGSVVSPDEPCAVADLDLDGLVSIEEMNVLAAHLGLEAGDCNHDGVPDADQIASGASVDDDGDGVPDECEDVGCGERLHRIAITGGDVPDQGIRDFEVDVPELGAILELRLHLRDFHHPWAEQLFIEVEQERGGEIVAAPVAVLCGVDWDFVGDYEFRDDAQGGRTICLTVSGGTIPEGQYVPVDAGFSPTFNDTFQGFEAGGTWRIRIQDTTADSFAASLGTAFLDIVVEGVSTDCDGDGEPDSCELDSDGDGAVDDCDACPDDATKTEPGDCGCGVSDTDSDGDGTPDCVDGCPLDPLKTASGDCGCGITDLDGDGDGLADCLDGCPDDPLKFEPGACGCGVPDEDLDGDGVPDCSDADDCNGNGIDDATEIADGSANDCNLDGVPDECGIAGEVVVFGEDSHGELAIPTSLPSCIDVSAGGNHVAALTSDGRIFCWGRNTDGECNVPTDLPRIVDVDCGAGHTLVLDEFGQVHAWGRNNYGQSDVPADLGTCISVSGGRFHTAAVTASGQVRCWGRDQFGESSVPADLPPAVAVAAGDYHTMALLESGQVVAWGRNDDGQCAVPDGLADVVMLDGGSFHSVALRADGEIVCWGRDIEGQLQVPRGLEARSVSAGWFCSLAIDREGRFHAWGGLDSGKGAIPPGLGELAFTETGGTHTVVLVAGDPPVDSDGDGSPDCSDGCPTDPAKQDPGACGCGVPDEDADGNGVPDCLEGDVVHVPGDFSSIGEAILYAESGWTIRLAPGIYEEVVDFQGKAVMIEGDVTNPASVILDGTYITGSSIVRMVTGEGPDSVLRGVTVRNGTSGTPFGSTMVGGAIHTLASSPTVEDCVFELNTAPYGGAVYARKAAPVFRRCVFRDNTAEFDGGGFQFSRTEGGVLEDCVFEDNTAGNNGGAIHLFGGMPSIIACTLDGNAAANGGGGVSWASTGQSASVVASAIVNNAAAVGGGIWIAGTLTDLVLAESIVCENVPTNIEGPFEDAGGNDLCRCPADFDGDGLVGGSDLGAWLAYAGQQCGEGEDCPWDLDVDGDVDGADLGLLLGAWGVCE